MTFVHAYKKGHQVGTATEACQLVCTDTLFLQHWEGCKQCFQAPLWNTRSQSPGLFRCYFHQICGAVQETSGMAQDCLISAFLTHWCLLCKAQNGWSDKSTPVPHLPGISLNWNLCARPNITLDSRVGLLDLVADALLYVAANCQPAQEGQQSP